MDAVAYTLCPRPGWPVFAPGQSFYEFVPMQGAIADGRWRMDRFLQAPVAVERPASTIANRGWWPCVGDPDPPTVIAAQPRGRDDAGPKATRLRRALSSSSSSSASSPPCVVPACVVWVGRLQPSVQVSTGDTGRRRSRPLCRRGSTIRAAQSRIPIAPPAARFPTPSPPRPDKKTGRR